ncbi:MAG: His/Gly/Thr/Pro-type tRNA ligase C-terminal domain-containing protein [Patescibacteria group bacterium]
MLRLKDTTHQNTASFLESAIGVAEYYGFKPLEDAPRRDSAALKQIRERARKNETALSLARKEERPLLVSGKRSALAARGQDESLLLWRTVNDFSSNIPHASLELHVVGTSSSIAEALLIVVANSIAEEAGVGERILSINNMGSGESSSRFVRDVANYLRKHIESISPTLRPRVALDPLGTLIALIERGHPATPRAPQSMEYLTEDERRRFWELLEYLEVYGLPYELSPHVLGSRDFWAHTLYQISAVNPESGLRMPIAFGGRYDPLAARFAAAPTSAAVISITCEIHGRARPKLEAPEIPSLYFAHLGSEARRKSLAVFEKLRAAGIRVHHGLCFDRINEQMAAARNLAPPYVLIMGHKEAIEGTIIVREAATNSQEVVSIPDLPNHLKRKKFFSVA